MRHLVLMSCLFASIATSTPFGGGGPSYPAVLEGAVPMVGEVTSTTWFVVRIPADQVDQVVESEVRLTMVIDWDDGYTARAGFGTGFNAILHTGVAESVWIDPNLHLDCVIVGDWCELEYDMTIESLGDYEFTANWWLDVQVQGVDDIEVEML